MIGIGVIGGAVCVANAELAISDVVYEIDGWRIISLVESDVVDSLLLFRMEDGPVPESNINAVWAQRTTDGWIADAWVGEDTASVVLWATVNLGLPDATDSGLPWPIDDIHVDVVGDVAAADPVPFADGVLAGSPFEPAVEMLEDPEPFLELLQVAGQAATSSAAVNTKKAPVAQPGDPIGVDDCGPRSNSGEEMWEAVAQSIEVDISGVGDMHLAFDEVLDPGGNRLCCRPRKIIHSLPDLPTTCGPWTRFGPPIPGVGGCTVTQNYRRDVLTTQRQICTNISIGCVISSTTQTRVLTEKQCDTTTFDLVDLNCNPGAFGVPPAPPVDPGCGSNCGGVSESPWTPEC